MVAASFLQRLLSKGPLACTPAYRSDPGRIGIETCGHGRIHRVGNRKSSEQKRAPFAVSLADSRATIFDARDVGFTSGVVAADAAASLAGDSSARHCAGPQSLACISLAAALAMARAARLRGHSAFRGWLRQDTPGVRDSQTVILPSWSTGTRPARLWRPMRRALEG